MRDTESIKKLLHDINSPLTSVMGYAELLKRLEESQEITSKEVEWISKINDDVLRLRTLIADLEKTLLNL